MVHFDFSPAVVVHIASGVAFVLLGLLVAWVGRGRPDGSGATRMAPANRAFAIFAGAHGLTLIAIYAIYVVDLPRMTYAWTLVVLELATFAGLVLLARTFPVSLGPGSRPAILVGILVGSLEFAAGLSGITGGESAGGIAGVFTIGLVRGGMWGLVAMQAMRYPGASPSLRRAHVAVAVALVLERAYGAGTRLAVAEPPTVSWIVIAAVNFGIPIIIASLWLWRASAAGDPRTGRNLAFITLGMVVLAMVLVPMEQFSIYWIVLAFARICAVLILAHAIVRHQILGIDVKARWTISRGTIAAVFLAVFFIAGEAAQQFFGAALDSAYLGIVAAGMLVFALAPLQRLADGLAVRAVPVDKGGMKTGMTPAEETFAMIARRLAADGEISADDEMTLARLATELGLSPMRTLAIRRTVDAESGALPVIETGAVGRE